MGNQANFLQSLGWAVLNSLWQLALLWVLYQLLTAIFRKTSAAAKSLLAASLLIAGFAWFIYTFVTLFAAGVAAPYQGSGFLFTDSGEELSRWLQRTLPIASIVYLVLLVLPLLRFMRNYRYVQVIRKFGLSRMQADWRLFVKKTAAQMGIKRPVLTWVSELVSSPVTIGFWKPVILVPLAAINHLTPTQLEAVLLHELSHIRRKDYLINLIINLVQTILYFNPFVKAFVKIVEREREKSCDEMVLQFQYDSHEYASALLTLEKAGRQQTTFLMAAQGKKNDLLHRIETIMGVKQKPVITFNKLAGMLAGLLCVIALNAVLIISRPAESNSSQAYAGALSPHELLLPDHETAGTTRTEAVTDDKEVTEQASEPAPSNNDPLNPVLELQSVPAGLDPAILQASLDLARLQTELSEEQEMQVKQAIEASKKVIEDAKWKSVEKEIADVFSRQEKERLRAVYEKELSKVDWKIWEDKLRQAYDNVNWEKVNEQLNNAVSLVRIDSLQRVYADAIARIETATDEMTKLDESGIPDTDITVKDLERKKQELLKLNKYLKGVRNKRIVRL